MGQQSLIYSFVARGTVAVAEYTEFTGNFTSIDSQCLQKLLATSNKFTYNCDGHTFNYLVDDGYTYCVVAADLLGDKFSLHFSRGSRKILQLLKPADSTGNLDQN